jgi:hypothetical protein
LGTNFYVRGFKSSDYPGGHLGKRSASGLFCWTCQVSLFKTEKKCFQCGAEYQENFEDSSVGRELGFNIKQPAVKTGVASCSSFTWAIEPEDLELCLEKYGGGLTCPCCDRRYEDIGKVIEDEYGRLYSLEEFKQVLLECPIEYLDMVGKVFF